jgi:hypothetical protein
VNNKATAYALVACLAGVSTMVSAAAYRWVDDNGDVHFTQEPPPKGTMSEKIKTLKDPRPKDAEAEPKNGKKPEEAAGKEEPKGDDKKDAKAQADAEKKALAEKKKQDAKFNKEACAKARANQKKLTESPRIKYIDKKGKATILKEEERQAKIKEAKDQVKKFCK